MLKKIIMLVAGLAIVMGIAACQQKENDATAVDSSDVKSEESESKDELSSVDTNAVIQTADNSSLSTATSSDTTVSNDADSASTATDSTDHADADSSQNTDI